MPVEMSMWRIDGDQPRRLTAAVLPSEKALEDFLAHDPSLLGMRLSVIGRQVRTPHGKYIDLLAMDAEGNLHVLELKRDRTPRDVVAQVIDYGCWVTDLGREQIIDLANAHLDEPFEVAFEATFGVTPPDELNGELQLTVVATDLDASSERIVTYLRGFGVPINAVFFSYLEDDGRAYLARTWLAPQDETTGSATSSTKKSKRADWNGRDWYISFGGELGRQWEDARKHGFVSAGGGRFYTQTIRSLPLGARVWVNLPGTGYVAVGTTLAPATRFEVAEVRAGEQWVPLHKQTLAGFYRKDTNADDDDAEWVVPVDWIDARPESGAYWEKGMFGSQHSACKLRQEFTLERLATHFGLDDE